MPLAIHNVSLLKTMFASTIHPSISLDHPILQDFLLGGVINLWQQRQWYLVPVAPECWYLIASQSPSTYHSKYLNRIDIILGYGDCRAHFATQFPQYRVNETVVDNSRNYLHGRRI